ncbi:MAG TPA: hypothetical protein V6C97_15260 [Oculatellaceae cyanobacterium]
MEKNDNSNYSFVTAADSQPPSRGFKVDRKLVIILIFLSGIVGLVVYFFPLMVSSSAVSMAGVDLLSKDMPAAMEHLNFAIQADPHSTFGYQYRGMLWAQLGQPEYAIADCTKAIEYGGGSDSNFTRGSQYYVLGKLNAALKDYQACIDKNGAEKATAEINVADAAYRLNDLKHSLAAANKAVELSPKEPVALLNRAQCFLCEHRYQAAVADLSKAIENFSQVQGENNQSENNDEIKRDIYLTRSCTYRAMKRDEDASSDLAEAKRIGRRRHSRSAEARSFESDFAQRAVRHYVTICSNLTESANSEYADRIEQLLTTINDTLFHVRTDKSFRIFIFPSQAEFRRFADEKKLLSLTVSDDKKGPMHSTALYSPDFDAVFTYQSDDLSATMRSVMKKVVADLPFGDDWSHCGVAELFENVSGYATTETASLYIPVELNPGSIPEKVPPLVEVTNTGRPQEPAPVKLAALFLIQTGKFPEFIKQSTDGPDARYSTVFESVYQQRAPQMEKQWQEFVESKRKTAAKSTAGTRGVIFTAKEQFEKQQKLLAPLKPLASLAVATSESNRAN